MRATHSIKVDKKERKRSTGTPLDRNKLRFVIENFFAGARDVKARPDASHLNLPALYIIFYTNRGLHPKEDYGTN